jgi:hypothetical protein
MRTSPLGGAEAKPKQTLPQKFSALLGRIATYSPDIAQEKRRLASYESVTAETLSLGRFVAANTDQKRTSLTQVHINKFKETIPMYSQAEIRDYLVSERLDGTIRPTPRTRLILYGNTYSYLRNSKDNFMCKFGVFDLKDGGRLVQAVPFEWESASYGFEHDSMVSTIHELFGEDPATAALEKYARINLGIIHPDGTFTGLRPFNDHAFGANLVPVLDTISTVALENNLDFQILEDRIEQF